MVWWSGSAFHADESTPRFILRRNLHGLVVWECVSCRLEHSEALCQIIYMVWCSRSAFRADESTPRYILTGNLQGLVAPECVSCRRERSNVHFDLLFAMVFEVLGVIFAQGEGNVKGRLTQP